ncbi:MAG: family 78 glycoside hydrolase catalytic domain [Eubacteriales bacterium]|nr:family 78 glycoside hydrolase catalytic domain [Eubacteriales bacterium]
MVRINRITVENLTKDCVTDREQPRFGFSIDSDQADVSLHRAKLRVGKWELVTDEQIALPYSGEPLQPFTDYELSVEAQVSIGGEMQRESISARTGFRTGRMKTPWSGLWISHGGYRFSEKKASPQPMYFRRQLRVGAGLLRAEIYSTALGVYELLLDGEKVGEDYFAPGYTAYQKQLQYQVYDITDRLQTAAANDTATANDTAVASPESEHELLVIVAGGWAVGAFNYKRVNRVYADRQAFLAEIRLTYADGHTEVIGTDESWQTTMQGRYRSAEFYAGEVYDATAVEAGWQPAVQEQPRIQPQLTATYGALTRAAEVFRPISVHRAGSGMLIYDMGQNFAGVIRAHIHGTAGQRVVFHHAEVLMKGELFTKPLRTALQQAVYICRDGEQDYSPRLTYMGFRYVGVEGIDEEDLELEAVALYSQMEDNGGFSCSDELVNNLQEAIRWGAKSNFVEIPTDCPQRDERMGWTGDIAVFAPTAVYNLNISRFIEKWLLDVKAEQKRGGGIPMVVPQSIVPWQWELMITMAVDHWGDACIWVPWAEYMARGDIEILRTMYPVMKRYLKACLFWAGLGSFGKRRRIWRFLHHYGDWCAPNTDLRGWMSKGRWTATAALARSSADLVKIAHILGEERDVQYYRRISEETAEAYRLFLLDKDMKLKKEFQTGYVLPLHYGLLNGEDKKRAAAHLARMVRDNDYHIATGFPGTPYILFALADNGYVDEAFRMLMQDGCPSWLYEVRVGGTTIWERWDALREDGSCNTGDDDGTGGMVSFNHYASGAVGDFLYRRVLGLEPIEAAYRRFRFDPLQHQLISSAAGHVETPYGRIEASWQRMDGVLDLTVRVPVGTVCELADGEQLGSGIHHRRMDSGLCS